MSVILLVVGLLVTGAGLVAIGFGIPINEFSLGNTLIVAGTTALCGGLVLIGLAAAVRELTRIAEALRGRPVPRAARSPEPKPAEAEAAVREPRLPEPKPAAAAPPAVDVSASAIERLRTSLPRPDRVVTDAEDVPLSPGAAQNGDATASRPASGAVETKEPRLDFLFRSRPTRPAAQPPSFDALWPKRGRDAQPRGEPASSPAAGTAGQAAQPDEQRAAPGPAASPAGSEESRSAAILKSGVVDGMAYTLYADGSIEAQLPQGTVRFGSIAELRAHIENNS